MGSLLSLIGCAGAKLDVTASGLPESESAMLYCAPKSQPPLINMPKHCRVSLKEFEDGDRIVGVEEDLIFFAIVTEGGRIQTLVQENIGRDFRLLAQPIRPADETPPNHPAPGGDTSSILEGLGYDSARNAELQRAGVV
jgi:hypothetical protein